MSKEAVVLFRKAVNASEDLQGELRRLEKLTPKSLSLLAAEHGYECTPEELLSVAQEIRNELTDFELELVTGGTLADVPYIQGSYGAITYYPIDAMSREEGSDDDEESAPAC